MLIGLPLTMVNVGAITKLVEHRRKDDKYSDRSGRSEDGSWNTEVIFA